MISKRYEIKKQVIGEDPDLEKSGRMLNRVIAWNRHGITIEADQRHVREILKGLESERANRSATPCGVERKDEGKGEHRRRKGQIQTEHERDGHGRTVTTGTDCRWQMMMTTTAQHSQGGNITRYRALAGTYQLPVARSTRSQVCIDAGVLCDGEADQARHGTRHDGRTIPRWEAGSEVVPLAAEW